MPRVIERASFTAQTCAVQQTVHQSEAQSVMAGVGKSTTMRSRRTTKQKASARTAAAQEARTAGLDRRKRHGVPERSGRSLEKQQAPSRASQFAKHIVERWATLDQSDASCPRDHMPRQTARHLNQCEASEANRQRECQLRKALARASLRLSRSGASADAKSQQLHCARTLVGMLATVPSLSQQAASPTRAVSGARGKRSSPASKRARTRQADSKARGSAASTQSDRFGGADWSAAVAEACTHQQPTHINLVTARTCATQIRAGHISEAVAAERERPAGRARWPADAQST